MAQGNSVAVAMSGGVDSSVAAALLKEAGYKVIGVSLHLWCEAGEEIAASSPRCCSLRDIEDARQVCRILGIPHYFLNFKDEFQSCVVDYFCQEYARGRTPNPCLLCNRDMKFRLLLDRVLAWGMDYLATGHYARNEQSDGKYRLLKAVDPLKDQTYFLYTLGQTELGRLLFPVGGYRKPEVRQMARQYGLPVASKRDSQEICFLPGGDYRPFLSHRLNTAPGDIVDTQGNVLGQHRGIACYTVGQRHGLGISSTQRLYVLRLDPAANRVVLGTWEELHHSSLFARELHWISGDPPLLPLAVTAKIRYQSLEAEATLSPYLDGVRVEFRVPQKQIAPGQSVVFYRGDEVLGGGIIEGPIMEEGQQVVMSSAAGASSQC